MSNFNESVETFEVWLVKIICLFVLLGFSIFLLIKVGKEYAGEIKPISSATEKKWEEARTAIDSGYDIYVNGIILETDTLADGFTSATYRILSINHKEKIVSLEEKNKNRTSVIPIIFR